MKEVSKDTFKALTDLLAKNNIGLSLSELHGVVTGFLVSGGNLQEQWFEALFYKELLNFPILSKLKSNIIKLAEMTQQEIKSGDFLLTICLPNDSSEISHRLEELATWCHYFLEGININLFDDEKNELKEAMNDLRDIANLSSDPNSSDNPEQDFIILEEHVKITALLIASILTTNNTSATIH